jgi:cysteine-rich repeat protein
MGGGPLSDDGSACADDAACAGNGCLTEIDAGWPSGYCAGDCDIAAPSCAGGGSCVDFGGVGRCLQPCAQSSDCRGGYECVDPGAGQTFCYPDCTQDAQCPTLGACDLASGLCTFGGGGGGETDCTDLTDNDVDNLVDCEDPTSCQTLAVCQPGMGNAGQPCAAPSDCEATGGAPVCFPEASLGWPQGYCSEFCAPGVPGGCSGDGVCVTGGPILGKAVCRDACAVDADCPTAGYLCEDIAPGVKACAPHCTADAQCSSFCNAETGLCINADEDCSNGIDDDFDQSSDCDDLDCIAGACGQAIQAACMAAGPAQPSNPGNTTNGTALFAGTCTGNGSKEHVFTYTPGVVGQVGTLSITLQSASDQGVYVRTACADGATELGCRDNVIGGTDEHLSIVVQGGQPLNIFVDSASPGMAGPFTLDVSFQAAICGDGSAVVPEECDDGNTTPGDGCDATCAIEYGLYCSAALTAQASNMGDTTGGTSVFQGSCTGAGAFEQVYAYTPATNGTLEIHLLSATDQGFYVRGSCGDAATEVACIEMASGGGTEYASLPVIGGQPLYVIVDGFLSPAEAGPYTLTFDLTP